MKNFAITLLLFMFSLVEAVSAASSTYMKFYIYKDDSINYTQSVLIGDVNDLTIDFNSTIKIDYTPNGNNKWAGIFWTKQPGLNMSDAQTITFQAKGAVGGEQVEFGSGGLGSAKLNRTGIRV